MKQTFSAVILTIVLSACAQGPAAKTEGATTRESKGTTSRPSTEKTPSVSRLDEKTYDHFGDGVAAAGVTITVGTLADKSKEFVGKKVRLTGDIQSVCKKKGCWMVLADGDQKIRISFRDYGFFMPLDSQGRTAVLEGTFDVTETSVAELKHLLEDEGKKEEAAKVTEPKLEMKVVADGVALKKR